MDCVIPGTNMKVMNKAIQTLSKIGDELYFQAKSDHLEFIAMNSNKTAYITISFLESFFSSYNIESSASGDICNCKINIKAIAGIFRGHKDKKIELCRITLQSETRLVVKLKYKQDVTMTHVLRLLDSEVLSINLPKNADMNQISGSSSLYSQILNMFQLSDDDISFDITKSKAVARNYDIGIQNSAKTIRTQVALNSSDFNIFSINQETNITLSLRPFRAAVQFAEVFNLNIGLNFQISGKPLIMIMKSPTFELNFVIATMNPEGVTQSTTFSSSASTRTSEAAISERDKTAIESINWDDEFDIENKSSKSKSKRSFAEIMDSLQKNSSKNSNSNEVREVETVIPMSPPESPRLKRAKMIFGRCYEPTFHETMMDLGEELAPNSDPESE